MKHALSCGLVLAVLCVNVLSQVANGQSARSTEPDVGIRSNPPSVIALTNAHVVISSSRTIENGSLLIRDGRILDVGVDIEIPDGSEIVDCGGDYLYPAFIDPMVEVDAEVATGAAAHWNPSVTPERRMADVLTLEESLLNALRKTGFGVALVAPKGGIIKGQSCVVALGDDSLKRNMLVDTAFQHVRLYPTRGFGGYPNSPMGAVALVRQTFSDAQWYSKATQAARSQPSLPTPEFDTALYALGAAMEGSQRVVIDGPNELYSLRADRIAREFSLDVIIRGSGREYRRLDELTATNRTHIIPVDFPDAPEVTTQQQVADTTLQELLDWELAPSNPMRLEKAGIDFVLTTDKLSDRDDFLKNVRLAVERGLSPEGALDAMTSRVALLLGIERTAGSLERGKLANVLRVSGPLLVKIDGKYGNITETWVQGERHIIEPESTNELEGDWVINLEKALFVDADLRIGGTAQKPTATIALAGALDEVDEQKESTSEDDEEGKSGVASEDDDKEGAAEEETAEKSDGIAKLKNVVISDYVFSGTFKLQDLVGEDEATGLVLVSATRLEKDGRPTLSGTFLYPDGTSSVFSGQLADEDEKENDASDEEASEADEASSEDGTLSESDEAAEDDSESVVDVNYPLGAYGLTEAPEQPDWLLIQDATIWTGSDKGNLESADMLIHAGIIDSIGTDLEAPEGAVIVDATGMHLSPGIIDCHSHMATDGGVNESGQAVTAEVRIGDFIDPNDITIYRQLAGGVTTSNILHGSANPIGGQNQVIKLRWGSSDEEMKMAEAPGGIKFALGENVKRSNRSSSENTRYPQSRMGVEQLLRDRFEAAKLYRQRWGDWTKSPEGLPPRRDYELDAIAEILEGTRWIHCHSYRQDEILTTLRVLEDYGITIGSLQHILEGYKVADAMAKHGATGSSFSDWWAYKFEVYDAIPYNGAIMHRAGVVVSFNSDDGELARHLNHEAAKAVKYGGVPPEEALQFVTLNPAKQLRIDEWVGSLEPGKHADFVLWNRSPLSTLSACEQTWIDGRKYFDREEDRVRREEDALLHQSLVSKIRSSGAKSGKSDDSDPSYWWARHDEFCHHFHEDEHEDH